jgi:spore protease
MHIPVFAIGIPTVVDSKTIVSDVIEGIIQKENVSEGLRSEYYDFIENILPGIENNSMVTPNEIDEVVTNISQIIANGINMSLN